MTSPFLPEVIIDPLAVGPTLLRSRLSLILAVILALVLGLILAWTSSMAIDYDPFCCACGGPFSHVELLNSSELGEDDRYLMNVVYDSLALSPAQSAVSLAPL